MQKVTRVEQEKQNEDIVVGKHVYGNLYGVDKTLLADRDYLVKIMREAARIAKSTIIDEKSWVVPGKKGGVSILILVNESHLALHTWVEYEYATLDIYTCGAHTDPISAFDYVVECLKPKKFTKHFVMRTSQPE